MRRPARGVLGRAPDPAPRLRRAEAGTEQYFRSCAAAVGVAPEDVEGPIELDVQFRSSGSAEFLRSLDAGLYGSEPVGFRHPRFYVNVHDTVEDLESALTESIAAGDSARLVAGFCWPWSDPNPDGSLMCDVQINGWERPWNRKAAPAVRYPPDKHPYTLWARSLPEPLSEVGCIYSAQGFEFDSIGVIWGPDLLRPGDAWIANPGASFDSEMVSGRDRTRLTPAAEALPLLLNAYRVLLTRCLRRCDIYCIDEETRDYLRVVFAPPAAAALLEPGGASG